MNSFRTPIFVSTIDDRVYVLLNFKGANLKGIALQLIMANLKVRE